MKNNDTVLQHITETPCENIFSVSKTQTHTPLNIYLHQITLQQVIDKNVFISETEIRKHVYNSMKKLLGFTQKKKKNPQKYS